MKKTIETVAVCALFAGLSAQTAAATEVFAVRALGTGAELRTELAHSPLYGDGVAPLENKEGGEEAKCGEGKCGGSKDKSDEAKCGEGKCGGNKPDSDKSGEGKCGEGKCGS